MNTAKQLAHALQEVYLDGKWVAYTNYKQEITPLNWKQATQQVHSLNSVALLTFHIDYYLAGVLQVLRGGALEIRDKFSFDMPSITSEKDWQDLKDRFIKNSEAMVAAVQNLDEHQIQAPFVDEKYGNYARNITGMVEHSYYHLGQIVLIKKLLLITT